MRRIRTEHKTRRVREDRTPILPIDPRDPDVVRAKQRAPRGGFRNPFRRTLGCRRDILLDFEGPTRRVVRQFHREHSACRANSGGEMVTRLGR